MTNTTENEAVSDIVEAAKAGVKELERDEKNQLEMYPLDIDADVLGLGVYDTFKLTEVIRGLSGVQVDPVLQGEFEKALTHLNNISSHIENNQKMRHKIKQDFIEKRQSLIDTTKDEVSKITGGSAQIRVKINTGSLNKNQRKGVREVMEKLGFSLENDNGSVKLVYVGEMQLCSKPQHWLYEQINSVSPINNNFIGCIHVEDKWADVYKEIDNLK